MLPSSLRYLRTLAYAPATPVPLPSWNDLEQPPHLWIRPDGNNLFSGPHAPAAFARARVLLSGSARELRGGLPEDCRVVPSLDRPLSSTRGGTHRPDLASRRALLSDRTGLDLDDAGERAFSAPRTSHESRRRPCGLSGHAALSGIPADRQALTLSQTRPRSNYHA